MYRYLRSAGLFVLLVVGFSCLPPLLRAPVDGTVTQGAGSHPGIDFGGPPFPMEGRPIGSICRGRVVYAANGWNGGCGNMVTVQHESGYKSDYCHMKAVAVSTGQYVGTGQLLGWVGNTGHSYGAHLHLQFWRNGVLLVKELNDTFPVGRLITLGSAWGAGLNPPLSCP